MRPKGFFMAAPVGNQQPAVQAQQPAQAVQRQAPLGTGEAPTTMQPAAGPAPRDVGYVESFLLFIRDLVVKFFSMIFSCFKKAEEPAAQMPVEQPQPPVPAPAQAPAPAPVEPAMPLLAPRVQEDINLLNEFGRLPEEVQERIYIRIGQDRHLHFLRRGSDLEVGREKVQADPQILLQYIVRP
jgi:hypothetical protein